jgi:type IV pilus assembly protein PilC
MVTGMIEVGEHTGQLPDMLTKIADIYDEEVDNAVAGLTSVIEPIMIVMLAGIVGTIVVAILLPIVRIVQMLS